MINFNGDFLPQNQHFFNTENRAFLFGDVLHEEVRFQQDRLLFFEEHYFNLMASMRMLRMEIPMEFTLEYLEDQIRKTLAAQKDQMEVSAVRVSVFRDKGKSLFPDNNRVNFTIEVLPLESQGFVLSNSDYSVLLYKDFMLPAQLLSSLQTANQSSLVLAAVYATENDFNDCFILNHHKEVIRTIRGAIFVVENESVIAPGTAAGAPGFVMRKILLEGIQKTGKYQVSEKGVSPFLLQKANEIFVMDPLGRIQSISTYRKATYVSELASWGAAFMEAKAKEA